MCLHSCLNIFSNKKIEAESSNKIKENILFIGANNTGKTSIYNIYYQNAYKLNEENTCGVDYHCQYIKYKNYDLHLNIYDSGGSEKHKSITYSYIYKCNLIVIFFDIADMSSFARAIEYYKTCAMINKNSKFILVSTRYDKALSYKYGMQVSPKEIENLRKKMDCEYIEINLKHKDKSIDNLFNNIYDDMIYNNS
jgi:small GTP-binding protein